MRKIEDLQENEAIHIRNKEEYKAFLKIECSLTGNSNISLKDLMKRYKKKTSRFDMVIIKTMDNYIYAKLPALYFYDKIIPATEFIPKSLSKKQLLKRIEKLEEDNKNMMHDLCVCAEKIGRLEGTLSSLSISSYSAIADNCSVSFKNVEVDFDKVESKLEKNDGWYKLDGALFYISNNKIVYGFDSEKKWLNIENDIIGTETPATEEEISKALIAESKKRGVNVVGLVYDEFSNMLYQNVLGFGKKTIFDNGVWGEIVEQSTEIDFSKAGLIVENEHGYTWITTGEHNEDVFSGIMVDYLKSNNIRRYFAENVSKQVVKLRTEPITLKNE